MILNYRVGDYQQKNKLSFLGTMRGTKPHSSCSVGLHLLYGGRLRSSRRSWLRREALDDDDKVVGVWSFLCPAIEWCIYEGHDPLQLEG